MPSVWITTRTTKAGARRYRVEYRLGGRGAKIHYGGSFTTKKDATTRRDSIRGDLVARRVPDLTMPEPVAPTPWPTVSEAGERWLAGRIDVADSTRTRHQVEQKRIDRLLGDRRVDELVPGDVADFVVQLAADGGTAAARSARPCRAGDEPRPRRRHTEPGARPGDPAAARRARGDQPAERRPRRGGVLAATESKHRLPLLWLDWAGARVGSVDLTLVGDYDEPAPAGAATGGTTKTRRPLWVDLHPVLADALEASLPPREDRDPDARLFAGSRRRRAPDVDREGVQGGQRAGCSPSRSAAPADQPDAPARMPWARIGEFVGQRDINVTANTYTHVLVDKAELDYDALLGADRGG